MVHNDATQSHPFEQAQQLWEPAPDVQAGQPVVAPPAKPGPGPGPSCAELDDLLFLLQKHDRQAPRLGAFGHSIYTTQPAPGTDQAGGTDDPDMAEILQILDDLTLDPPSAARQSPPLSFQNAEPGWPQDWPFTPPSGRPRSLSSSSGRSDASDRSGGAPAAGSGSAARTSSARSSTSASSGRPATPPAFIHEEEVPEEERVTLPPLDHRLAQDRDLQEPWTNFTTTTGQKQATAGMRFISNGLIYLVNQIDGQEKKAAQLFRDQQPPRQADRKLNSHLRQKQRAQAYDTAMAASIVDPTQPFMRQRGHVLAQMEPMMPAVLTALHAGNQSEKAALISRLWEPTLPLMNSNDPFEISDVIKTSCKELCDLLQASVAQACLPPMQEAPAYISRPGVPHPLADKSQRHQRLLSNMQWLGQSLQRVRVTDEGVVWVVRDDQDIKLACIPLLKSMRSVMTDTIALLSVLYPGIDFDTGDLLENLNDSIASLQQAGPAVGGTGASARASRDRLLADMEVMYRQGLDALIVFDDLVRDRTDDLQLAPAAIDTPRSPAPDATAGDAVPKEDSQAVDAEPEDELPLDSASSSDIDEDSEDDSVDGETTGQARARSPAASTSAPAATATAGARHQAAAQRPAARALAVPQPAQPEPQAPELRFREIATIAAVLDEMAAGRRMATPQMLEQIADRMMSSGMAQLPERDRQALLQSLLPHVEACTRKNCAMTFDTLQPMLRAAAACKSQALCSDFSTALAENLLIKPEGPAETAAFSDSVLSGDAFELLMQLRGLTLPMLQAVLGKLLHYFTECESTVTPAQLTAALEQRNKGILGAQACRRASLARVLAGISHMAGLKISREIADVIARMYGLPLPPELVKSRDRHAWEVQALSTFKGAGNDALYLTHDENGKRLKQVTINVHNTGSRVLRWLLEEHFAQPAAPGDKPETRRLKVVVGSNTHNTLHGQDLRKTIDKALEKFPAWSVSKNQGTTVTISRTGA